LLATQALSSYQGNYALKFDGIDDFVAIQKTYMDDLIDQFWTLEAWVMPEATQQDMQLNIVGFPARHPNLEYCGPNNPQCEQGETLTQLRANNTQYFTIVDKTTKLTPNEWHHIAGTWDNVTLNLYVDGKLVRTSDPYAGGFIDGPCAEYCEIGFQIGGFRFRRANDYFSRQYFTGQIDEVRVWRVGRTQNEIASSMSTTLTGAEPGLQYYWRFDEGAGTLTKSLAMDGYGLLGGGQKTARPTFVSSTAPLTATAPPPSHTTTIIKKESGNAVAAGVLLSLFFLLGGTSIGAVLGFKARERRSQGLLMPWETSRDVILGDKIQPQLPPDEIQHEISGDDDLVQ
jgi:hypothetical protein